MQNHDYVTYEEFGRRFFEVAVTPDRVAAAFADIAGSEFAMEPISQGPGGIAKVSANVKIREPRVTRKLGDLITFVIHIPLSIDLLLDLRLDKQRFMVAGDIALRATARAAEPLLLIVDVAKPRPSDITVNVSSKSIRGEVLRILAGVDGEIRRFIAQYVSAEIDSPKSQAAQVINVADNWTLPGAARSQLWMQSGCRPPKAHQQLIGEVVAARTASAKVAALRSVKMSSSSIG
ncbi:Uncharacterised protein [Mycobacterium tuberculosis]|nr:Uncharacterised protein [Mycobacterium tuberculosis]